jgi:hypothetical protein
MLRNEIIQQLNDADIGPGFAFPNFSLFYPIDARLSLYRSDAEWVLVIETLVFSDAGVGAHEGCQTMLFCYGSDLPQPPGIVYPHLYVTGDGPSGPLFDPVVDTLISPTATDMTIRGKVVPVTTDPAQYAAAGIELRLLSSSTETWAKYKTALAAAGADLGQPPRVEGYELLRLTVPKHRRPFFVTDAEITERIGKPMPLLLRLDEWRHPDKVKGEAPADSESFQMIADVIAHNDPSLYQPTEPPNTHWRNWPMAGML